MKRFIFLLFPIVLFASEGWTPPENPDPSAILKEAYSDRDAGRHEIALQKHIWYHENALAINEAQAGVRLSYALTGWHKLSKKFPPALKKLKGYRTQAQVDVLAGKGLRDSFHDLTEINRTLGVDEETQKLFETLHVEKPDLAKQVVDMARPALLKGKAYKLLDHYVDPVVDFELIQGAFVESLQFVDESDFGGWYVDFLSRKFEYDTSVLIALLTTNRRFEDALTVAELAKKERDNESFLLSLEKALKGTFPIPWP